MAMSLRSFSSLTRRTGAGVFSLLVGAVGSTVLSPPAHAAPESVSVKDERHDVRIVRGVKGLTLAQRKAVDLRRVWVSPGDGTTRFTVRLRKVLRDPRFDQAIFLDLTPAPGSTATWSGQIGLSPQRAGLSYAGLDLGTGTDFESCDPLRATVLRRTNRVSVDVPSRCLPEGEVSIVVTALTAYFRSDGEGPWSQDKLKFPTPVVLR